MMFNESTTWPDVAQAIALSTPLTLHNALRLVGSLAEGELTPQKYGYDVLMLVNSIAGLLEETLPINRDPGRALNNLLWHASHADESV